MPISMGNLTQALRSSVGAGVGQVHYLVDSDFRTAAQGWARADGTGPLDLYRQDKSTFPYTFRTGDFASDDLAITAAINAMVDFRGDILFLTPGAYAWTTVVDLNVPAARYLGTAYKSPKYGCAPSVRNTRIALNTNANMLTIGASQDMELAYISFTTVTALNGINFDTANDNMYWHDFGWFQEDIGGNTATAFSNVSIDGGYNYTQFDQFTGSCNTAMGPMFDVGGDVQQVGWSNWKLVLHESEATWPTGLVDVATAGNASEGLDVGPGLILAYLGAGATVMTNLVTGVDITGDGVFSLHEIITPGLTPAATALDGGTTGDYELTQNFMATSGGSVYTTA